MELNKKQSYPAPVCEEIEIRLEGIVAASVPQPEEEEVSW